MDTRFIGFVIALTLMLYPASEASGQTETDSIATSADLHEEYRFSGRELILPGTLITIGIAGYFMDGFYGFNKETDDAMSKMRGSCYFHLDDYLQYLPAVTYLTFDAIGIKGKHTFKERVAVEATAYLAMTALTNIGKHTFREKRPDTEVRNSFPSGHTATAFTGAELMRIEYGLGLGIASYALATGVSFLRMYNGRHWLNDVIAGAGIGILSARIGYWMLPLYRKWFGWDKAAADSSTLVISPRYEPEIHGGGIALLYTF